MANNGYMKCEEFNKYFQDKYDVGKEIYNLLLEQRPNETEIVVCPAQLGDTVWLAAYAFAYKLEHHCKLLYVVKKSQQTIIENYCAIDAVLDIDSAQMEALELFIVRNELWYENHILFGNHRESIITAVDKYYLALHLDDYADISEERRSILKLKNDAILSRMNKEYSFDAQKKRKYDKAVVLMPSANTFKLIPLTFWQKLSRHLSEYCGKKVYTNYNGLDSEIMVNGTEALPTSLSELKDLSQYIELFIGLRSGICDYLAACDANLAIIYSQDWKENESGEFEFSSSPQKLGSKAIHNFPYLPEEENNLIMKIASLLEKQNEININILIDRKVLSNDKLLHLKPWLVNCLDFGNVFFLGTDKISENDKNFDANEIIPFEEIHRTIEKKMQAFLAGRELSKAISEWYYNQFVKMKYSFFCEDEYYMVWDWNLIPSHKIDMFEKKSGMPYLDSCDGNQLIKDELVAKLFPGCSLPLKRSFDVGHMTINAEIMRDLIQKIEENEQIKGDSFWTKILNLIPPDKIQSSPLSLYSIYGIYVAVKYPEVYILREWKQLRQVEKYFDILSMDKKDFDWLSKDFDAVTFENTYDIDGDVQELFANQYYREKLTPKKILDAIDAEKSDEFMSYSGECIDGKDTITNEIIIEDRLKYLDKNTFEEYEKLGDSLIDINPDQAYLCYENAAFLCDYQDQKIRILEKSNELKNKNKITVKKTAIVILSFNHEYLLKRCIESIYNNCNPKDYLLVIFDNGSKDGTAEWLAEWGKNNEDALVILNEENLGFSGGNNAACQYLSEDYDVFFLNNDTRVPANALFWMRMALYEADDIGGVGAVQNYADADQIQDVTFDTPEQYVEFGAKHNVFMDNPCEEQSKICGFALLVKRQAWDKTGGFDERFNPGYVEDDEISMHIRSLGYRMMVCHNAFIYHVGSQSFIRVENPNDLFVKHREIIIKKWGFDTTIYAGMSKNEYAFILDLEKKGYKKDSYFKLVHIGSGCGNMLGHIHYLYPNAELAGVEENDAARKFAISCIPVYPNIDSLPRKLEEYDVIAYRLG